MKLQVISRSEREYTRERATDIQRVYHNLQPLSHPFERAREYKRALNAVKLDKIFARPFVAALDGHRDSVSCFATNPNSLVSLVSGACDGEVKVWDLPNRCCMWSSHAHSGFVRGLSIERTGSGFVSCGDDRTVKYYPLVQTTDGSVSGLSEVPPSTVWNGKSSFLSIDCSRSENHFVTCSRVVDLWDFNASSPIASYNWGIDVLSSVKICPSQCNILAATAKDRGIVIYDTRSNTPVHKVIMKMISNSLCWNPVEPFHFTVSNDDFNLYTFDMRHLEKTRMVHKDHVMCVAYSPTGQEFVSGSFDKTIRIFDRFSGRSKQVYHGKRMQRVACVAYSGDAQYILSGSDDTNIRIWKRYHVHREKVKLAYQNELKRRFQHLPEIRRIARHHHVPSMVKNIQRKRHVQTMKAARKRQNQVKNNRLDEKSLPVLKKSAVLREVE